MQNFVRLWVCFSATPPFGLTATLAVYALAVALGWAVGLPQQVLRSLAPKSATAPVATGIAQQVGGIPTRAAVFAVVTGPIGAASGKLFYS